MFNHFCDFIVLLSVHFAVEKKIQVDFGEDPEELDFFHAIFPADVIAQMAEETNRYAAQFLDSPRGRNLKPQSRFSKWRNVSTDEMKCFLSLVMDMGLVQQQDLHDYWSKDSLLQTPFFGSVSNRFLIILSMFHLNDNTTAVARGQDGYDRLHKLRPQYNSFRKNIPQVYSPGKKLGSG